MVCSKVFSALASQAVIPEIEGDAPICDFANGIVDERDPLTYWLSCALSGAR
jgi:proline racemase